jgi:hypothetical protein
MPPEPNEFSILCEEVLKSTTSDMAADKLSNMAMLTMLVWIVRNNIPSWQRKEFIEIVRSKFYQKFVAEYHKASQEPVQDLNLAKPEDFDAGLNKRLDEVANRLRGLLLK